MLHIFIVLTTYLTNLQQKILVYFFANWQTFTIKLKKILNSSFFKKDQLNAKFKVFCTRLEEKGEDCRKTIPIAKACTSTCLVQNITRKCCKDHFGPNCLPCPGKKIIAACFNSCLMLLNKIISCNSLYKSLLMISELILLN